MAQSTYSQKSTKKHPWLWVPSTYFMEGFPGVMIMFVLGIMYKNFGISNSEITLYTGALVLPWVIKPLWASLIDIFFTKRWWIYAMEIFFGCLFILMAITIKTPNFFFLSIAVAWAIAFLASTHDIATDGFYIMELSPQEQSFFVGTQSASYNIGKIFSKGLIVMFCGLIYAITKNYFTAWSYSLIIVGAICIGIGLYHFHILPKDENIKKIKTLKHAFYDFIEVYVDFIKMEGLIFALLFLFFYKLGESMLNIVLPLFLLDPIAKGGLGLTNTFTGLATGAISPVAIILGGLLGGYAIYRKGFRFWIWWMLLAENIPNTIYIILAHYQITNHLIILPCIVLEQFCFSFGYSAYLIFIYYMVRNSQFKTAHYAFFAGIMLLGVMIPNMVSGWLQELVGYKWFFIIVIFTIIPAALVIKFMKMEIPDYGKKVAAEK